MAGLAIQKSLGKVFCSGPSNAAVDSLAYQLDRIATSVCDRYNEGKMKGDPSRARRPLVVRGYNAAHEIEAVWQMLQHPDRDPGPSGNKTGWNRHLSVAYWFLVLMGSQANGIRELDEDDSEVLHQMRREMEERDDLEKLRYLVNGWATGWMTCEEWVACKEDVKIEPILNNIICHADLLCTTPAQSAQKEGPYLHYKFDLAQGILIDNASSMHRADYACVAGNCLLPCVMGGDLISLKELRQQAVTGREKNKLGHFYNRLADDGAISPLMFFQASGIPVYRVTGQLQKAHEHGIRAGGRGGRTTRR